MVIDMAPPAIRQDVIQVPGIASVLEALDVVRFQPAGLAAAPATVTVSLEHGAPGRSPAPGIQGVMISAHLS